MGTFPNQSTLGEEQFTVVLFSSQRTQADPAGYDKAARRMVELAEEQPGYLGMESVRDKEGRGITLSFWKDRASALAWKGNLEHREVQRAGQERWYDSYVVRIARAEEQYWSGRNTSTSEDSGAMPEGARANGNRSQEGREAASQRGPKATGNLGISIVRLSHYNAWANGRLLEATGKLHENHYDVEIGKKSVRGLWNHLMRGDEAWLDRFRGGTGESDLTAIQQYSFDEIRSRRTKPDQDIIEFFSDLEASHGSEDPDLLQYRSNLDGLVRRLPMGHLYFHFFNHQTHHRGQLTVVLRQLGVASEMMDFVWME
jgi:uncharacterized damage-inducible protein DinB/heme-degrading monooxygenase HmoA